jgi:hypothetical protein
MIFQNDRAQSSQCRVGQAQASAWTKAREGSRRA